MNIISRKVAKAAGQKRYFTGTECPHGHMAERLVSNYGCIQCAAGKFSIYYQLNADRLNTDVKKWRVDNKEQVRKSKALWESLNKERKASWNKKSYQKNRQARIDSMIAYKAANLQRCRDGSKNWKQQNHARVIATVRARECRKIMAVPKWADATETQAVYEEALRLSEATGVKYHVDHVVPLMGRSVCGLHVANNLRAIPATENLAKGNAW